MSENNEITARFRDKPDMSTIWLYHLDRVNRMAGQAEFEEGVHQLFRLLPAVAQLEVFALEDTYCRDEFYFKYKYSRGGRRLGGELSPAVYNYDVPAKRLENGQIDWDDPNIRSPTREIRKLYDVGKYFLIIANMAERYGLSWNTETEVVNVSRLPEPKRDKTPYLGDDGDE